MERKLQEARSAAQPKLVWGTKAIAGLCQIEPRKAYHLMRTGRLPVKKVGATYVGEEEALLKFLTTPEVAA
ncbi:hypothetical protein [Aureimonas phyllosphaerae]|uniref:Helix-turn-helix domain-containing protein n=1 Tax=Aureimonas phyllosphaerae TaxID=1166078 RepID=A0A7W6FST4_9HYPH|nr:hypothetical protein [Aureimonas phyllosphaerae]MBB3934276.1 hypothetical protein [Aureimonas phyllosphaerae]MBB3958508.1 hypothetical protein [Aureimonas phyllosphaerae]SFE98128.1 hypothetical protein SAMN05216566_101484 [Aureimonas phyllosphaerae]